MEGNRLYLRMPCRAPRGPGQHAPESHQSWRVASRTLEKTPAFIVQHPDMHPALRTPGLARDIYPAARGHCGSRVQFRGCRLSAQASW